MDKSTKQELSKHSNEELIQIYANKNKNSWQKEASKTIVDILRSRGIFLPHPNPDDQ